MARRRPQTRDAGADDEHRERWRARQQQPRHPGVHDPARGRALIVGSAALWRRSVPHLEEAALDLGATPLQAFFKVILPEITPGIFTGALMAFTLSLDDFIVSFFTTGSGVATLSIKIYSMTKRGVSPTINALSSIMFVVLLTIMFIVQIRQYNEPKKNHITDVSNSQN